MADGLHYFAEALPGGRAQLRADLVTDGRVESSWPVGSPAAAAEVEAAAVEANRHAAGTRRRLDTPAEVEAAAASARAGLEAAEDELVAAAGAVSPRLGEYAARRLDRERAWRTAHEAWLADPTPATERALNEAADALRWERRAGWEAAGVTDARLRERQFADHEADGPEAPGPEGEA